FDLVFGVAQLRAKLHGLFYLHDLVSGDTPARAFTPARPIGARTFVVDVWAFDPMVTLCHRAVFGVSEIADGQPEGFHHPRCFAARFVALTFQRRDLLPQPDDIF